MFKNYFELLPEIRMVIIDTMEPADRCRFTRCSKLCKKEAKSSKKFMNALKIYGLSKDFIAIEIRYNYDMPMLTRDELQGCLVIFEKEIDGRNYLRYKNLQRRELWNIELQHYENLPHLAVRYFRCTLKQCQNVMKRLEVRGPLFNDSYVNIELGIQSLNNLEEVQCCSEVVFRQIFEILRNPLKVLEVSSDGDCESLTSFKEIYQVTHSVSGPMELTYHQLLRLRAARICVEIGDLTIEEISYFINSWRNGSLRDNFEYCCWRAEDSNFREIFREVSILLGVQATRGVAVINHKRERGRRARLSVVNVKKAVVFEVIF